MAVHGIPFHQLFPPWNTAYPVALPPPQVVNAPFGLYGIAYDLFTNNIEANLPSGWAKQRSSVYREIKNYMRVRGFNREQYSVWQRDIVVAQAWSDMIGMRDILPRGIIPTVLRRLELIHIPLPNHFIVTNDIQLGGAYAPGLVGPTPGLLSQGMGVVPPGGWPNAAGDRLPFGVRNIAGSLNPNNWRL